MVKDLVLEIYCFEIPACFVAEAASNLSSALAKEIKKYTSIEKSEYFYTSKRLVFRMGGCNFEDIASMPRIRGPRLQAPEQAVQGFMARYGISDKSMLSEEGGHFFCQEIVDNQKVGKVISRVLEQFTWPSSMKWNNGDIKWIRPIEYISCSLGDEIISVAFGKKNSSSLTKSPQAILW